MTTDTDGGTILDTTTEPGQQGQPQAAPLPAGLQLMLPAPGDSQAVFAAAEPPLAVVAERVAETDHVVLGGPEIASVPPSIEAPEPQVIAREEAIASPVVDVCSAEAVVPEGAFAADAVHPVFSAPDPSVVSIPIDDAAAPIPAPKLTPTPASPGSGSVWTIPLLCAGLALIACCLLIPQADENRRLTYERERLRQDLEQVQKQVAVNDEFIKRVSSDPNLAERLAQRQLRVVREGTAVLELPEAGGRQQMSPFLLVTLPPPPPLPPYKPIGGRFAEWCRQPRTNLHLIGLGLFMVAGGLILGAAPPRQK